MSKYIFYDYGFKNWKSIVCAIWAFLYPWVCFFKSFSFCLLSFFLMQLNTQVVSVKIHVNVVWTNNTLLQWWTQKINKASLVSQMKRPRGCLPRNLTSRPLVYHHRPGFGLQPSRVRADQSQLTYITFSETLKNIN